MSFHILFEGKEERINSPSHVLPADFKYFTLDCMFSKIYCLYLSTSVFFPRKVADS